MRRTLHITACIAIVTALNGCQTPQLSLKPVAITDDSRPLIEQIELSSKAGTLAIGAEKDRLHQQSKGLGLVSDPPLEAYLNQILQRLKKTAGTPGLPGKVYLKAVSAASAFSTADGNIYIPYNFLVMFETEDSIAAVLAHELAHVLLSHTNADLTKRLQRRLISAQQLFMYVHSDKLGKVIDERKQATLRRSMLMLAATNQFINPAWTRAQEVEADKLGLDLIVRAGYSKSTIKPLFEILKEAEAQQELHKQRNKQIEKRLQEEASLFKNSLQLDKGPREILGAISSAGAMALTDILSRIESDHPTAEERLELINIYSKKHYRKARLSKVSNRKWQSIISSPHREDLRKSLKRAFESYTEIDSGKKSAAYAAAKQSLDTAPTKQLFAYQALADANFYLNRTKEELARLDEAKATTFPSFKIFLRETEEALKHEQQPQTRSMLTTRLNKQFSTFGRPPHYLLDMIRLADASANKPLRLSLKTECHLQYGDTIDSCDPDEKHRDTDRESTATLLDKLL